MAQQKLHSAWQWLRRTVFRMKRKPDVYDCKLREVFWEGDRELAIRVARVCVLFEDLRLEYIGSRATEDLPLDALSKQHRKFYFLRRSLVSLDEFCGALNRLNEVKAWKKYVESHDDKRRRKMWADAVKFFNAKKKRIETIRGDIGGHFPESAAKWSVERLHEDTTGALQIDYGDKTADAKLPFTTELVASVILRTAREQELPDDEMKAFISGIFDDVTDGWQHAVDAVHVVIAEYLMPRFRE
jgi:hypothetical protein